MAWCGVARLVAVGDPLVAWQCEEEGEHLALALEALEGDGRPWLAEELVDLLAVEPQVDPVRVVRCVLHTHLEGRHGPLRHLLAVRSLVLVGLIV